MGATPRHMPEDKTNRSWTAIRCRRLLRPLQSRLTVLRKLSSVTRAHEPSTAGIVSRKPKKRRRGPEASTEIAELRKRQRRTYSQKGSSSVKAATTSRPGKTRENITWRTSRADGLLSIATPLLHRTKSMLDDRHSGAFRPFPVLREGGCDEALPQSLSLLLEMRSELGGRRHGICEGILGDLAAILRSTSSQAPIRAPRSLLSMCLRQIPKFLARADEEERLEAQSDSSLTDLSLIKPSARIYDELETFGSVGCGWKGLPTLVRAHALSMLKEATTTGLFTPNFANLLVNYYQLAGYTDDSWELADALLQRNYPGPQNSQSTFKANDELKPLAILSGLAARPANASHICRATYSLVESRRLPAAWLSTRALQFFWVLSAGELLDKCASTHSLQHLTAGITYLCLSYSQRDSNHYIHKPLQALTAVIGAMIAMALVSGGSLHRTDEGDRPRQGRTLVQSRVLHIFQVALLGTGGRIAHEKTRDVLRLGIFFVTMSIDGFKLARKCVTRGGFSPATLHQLGEIAVSLTCRVAEYSSRVVSTPPNQIYSLLFDQLELLQLPGIKKLRRDGAFMLARETDDLRDLVFAENEQSSKSTPEKTPSASMATHQSTFSGYRWEEGISEWVVASPVKLDMPVMLTNDVSKGREYRGTFSTEAASRSTGYTLRDREVTNTNRHSAQRQAKERQAQASRQGYQTLTLRSEGHDASRKLQRSIAAQQENRTPNRLTGKTTTGAAASTRATFWMKGGRAALGDLQLSHRTPESDDELMG